ncbi:MAG TPA: geranylgeranylglycerol-phosphate geranylgeranyltransferase [Bacteroidia bacterium]|nr:geranylgeranylglycerol-phosphate geranylgeranyltransferase [Bacteroidia bacterium]HRG51547.1 geranylgeranylglycerol-phosphate geranylgeranyltransferase [Bacteroidia bacterium]
MLAFLKLIRTQNLLIIAFTQYMVRWCLLYPLLLVHDFELQLSNFQFFLLVLSTVMIAAAGYIINDYFDVVIDKVNKPERLVIDKGVKRRVAMGAHVVINILAVLIAFYVSYQAGSMKLIIFHVLCATGLWFYSTNFKRQFLIGNILISLFTSLVPFIVGVYELMPVHKIYAEMIDETSLNQEWRFVIGISFFAFITTLIREIIKDMEDVEGDERYGCKTMPIVIGMRTTRNITIVLSLITMAFLVYFQTIKWSTGNLFGALYIGIGLQVPFIYLIYRIVTAKEKKDYKVAGNVAKLIMLLGVCYLFVFAQSILSYS